MLCVVSGLTCGAGKTSIAAGLMAATVQADWVAMRISNRCLIKPLPEGGHRCMEEPVANSRTEAGRYLASGAKLAYSLRISASSFEPAMPYVRKLLRDHDNVLIEASCPLPELPADLSLYVTHHEEPAASPEHWTDYVDAYIMVDPGRGERTWRGSRPFHLVSPCTYVNSGLVQMVRERLRPRLAPKPKLPVLTTL